MIIINRIKNLLSDKKKIVNYSDLSPQRQKDILLRSAIKGNEDQQKILREYERKFKTAN